MNINNTVELNVKIFGELKKETSPLIALHGILGSGDNLRLLKQLPYQLHLPDLRNHGDSPHHPDASLAAMSQDILHYLDEKNIEKTHLLGHSMGARIAMYIAMNYPSRIDKLIIADMAPREYAPSSAHTLIFKAMREMEQAQITTRQQADELLAQHINERTTRQFILKSLHRLEDGTYAWKIAWKYLQENHSQWNHNPIQEQQIYTGSGAFIYGMNSDYVTPVDHPTIRKNFPHMEIIGLSEAGHWLHAEQPQLFLQEVTHTLNP